MIVILILGYILIVSGGVTSFGKSNYTVIPINQPIIPIALVYAPISAPVSASVYHVDPDLFETPAGFMIKPKSKPAKQSLKKSCSKSKSKEKLGIKLKQKLSTKPKPTKSIKKYPSLTVGAPSVTQNKVLSVSDPIAAETFGNAPIIADSLATGPGLANYPKTTSTEPITSDLSGIGLDNQPVNADSLPITPGLINEPVPAVPLTTESVIEPVKSSPAHMPKNHHKKKHKKKKQTTNPFDMFDDFFSPGLSDQKKQQQRQRKEYSQMTDIIQKLQSQIDYLY